MELELTRFGGALLSKRGGFPDVSLPRISAAPGTAIEIPSVKRRPASSPVLLFLRLPYGPVQLSRRSSRCCSAFCSRSGMGRDGPGALGWYEGADGANYQTTSSTCVGAAS
jgi:hypothetical protein